MYIKNAPMFVELNILTKGLEFHLWTSLVGRPEGHLSEPLVSFDLPSNLTCTKIEILPEVN